MSHFKARFRVPGVNSAVSWAWEDEFWVWREASVDGNAPIVQMAREGLNN